MSLNAAPGTPAEVRPANQRWPLIGRDEEMILVSQALAPGGAGALVLAGPAGVGKTRLGREALRLAEAGGAATEWVAVTAGHRSVPFGAFAQFVSLPTTARDHLELFEATATAFAARAGGSRLVLGVDDADALDDASASLLLNLAHSGAVFVVATVRTGQPCPDPVVNLWKDDFGLRLEVQPLSYNEVMTLLERVLGGPFEHTSGHRLFEASQGNALLLRELVVAGIASRGLDQREGLWWYSGGYASARLHDLVEARLVGLAGSERRCVELVALGEPLPLEVLQACADEAAISASEQRGIVEVALDPYPPVARLCHPLYGSVLRETMAPPTRRARCRELAKALSSRPPENNLDAVRLASLWLGAGEAADPGLCTAGAHGASAAADHGLAARLATAALNGGGGLPAAMALASALAALGQAEEAEGVLSRFEAVAREDPAAGSYLGRRALVLHRGLGRTAEAFLLLDRAERWRRGMSWRRTVAAPRLRLLVDTGHFQTAVDHGLSLLADRACDGDVRASVAGSVGRALVQLGRVEEGVALAEAAQLVAGHGAGPQQWLQAVRTAALCEQGRWAEAETLLEDGYRAAVRRRDPVAVAVASYQLGRAHFGQGALEAAGRAFREALGHLEVSDPKGIRRTCLAYLASVVAMSGDGAVATAYYRRALAAGPVDSWWARLSLARAEVWIDVATGETSLAQERALDHARSCAGQPLVEAHLLYEAMRAGCPGDLVAARLGEISTAGQSPLTVIYAAHAAARAAGDGHALDDVAGRLEQTGAALLAAEAFAEASSAHLAAGRRDLAQRARGRSDSLAAACGPAQTPALACPSRSTLTTREQEVAALAARGLSNADIARRLTLSVRTVESHLYRAAYKMGVNPRAGSGRPAPDGVSSALAALQ